MIDGTWQEFLKIVREEVGSRVVETWFKAISLHRWDASQRTVYLQAPNAFVQNWVCKHYMLLLQLHLGRLLHVESPKIVFEDDKTIDERVHTMPTVVPVNVLKTGTEVAKSGRRKQIGQVNQSYSFDTFVVGSSNSLAYAAAHAITEKPGTLYNPLFIYGGSGLGKTHLLHAIGNEIKAKNKHRTILYQTADRFVTEFINAIRFDKVHRFRAKYQSIDVLLVDDLQFISNKEQTQEAFFHIFNSLYEANKQIVFSSDTFPQHIEGIAERLSSRLASGLVTDIHMPSLETKVAILKKKAVGNNEVIDDGVAHFIASHVVSNIRELEGALIRVMAFASLTNQSVTLELAKRVLLRSVEQKKRVIDFNRIITTVGKHYSYTLTDLRSKNRNKDLAQARHVAMFLMKKMTDKSLRDIGSFLGGRDHSTVMHALDKVHGYIEEQPDLQSKIKRIEQDIMR